MSNPVFRPNHYARCVIEPMTYAAANRLNMVRGNAVKYITRAGFKGGPEQELEDLRKAIRCIEMEIESISRWRRVDEGESAPDVWKDIL